jgi:OmpA family
VLQTNITPTPVPAINQIRVSGSGWLTTVSATTKTGAVLPLVGGGLAVTAGAKFNFMSTGYLPNTSVNVYVMSTPQLLGTYNTDANGNLFVSVTLPTTLANGGHTIQLNGIDKGGYVRSASLGFGLSGATSGGTNGGGTNGGGTTGGTAKTATVKAFYTFGSVTLSAAAKTALKGLVAKIGKAKTVTITATGVTRNVGTTAVDLATAAKRAKGVVAYLKTLGVKATFVSTSTTGPGDGNAVRRVDVKATYK